MTNRQDFEADVSGGRQEWQEPALKLIAKDIRDVYAPVRGPHPDLERAIREVSDAEIRGAFIGRHEALRNGG